ncbi:hypothetical protein OROGR_009132 [Orobanche gracilis]
MFYSQFILAKKGPLGTIWIAAHLERKLRKNQVADTDIGVSVDSILSPEVPIALRLSSHLLLGVVRIYNRKVNYLFDDCSEALLKVKQAFRSTDVDLPPEESKAPYHSITLPEKFDLDDFELPDSDIFQGNYVDRHISSREQITLQDSMEGVSYSTSKFGLDERFGDGDASGLDLDEFLAISEPEGSLMHSLPDYSADPQASYRSMPPLKQEEHPEDRTTSPETMADGADEPADLMDYAQAPRTPGLVEEPNLLNAKSASACDDHMEIEYCLMEPTVRENGNNVPYEDKQEVDWCSQNDTISNGVPHGQHEENGHLSSGLVFKLSELQGESPIKAIRPPSEFTDRIEAPDIPLQEDSLTEDVKEDKTIDETSGSEVDLEKSASENFGLASTDQQVLEGVSAKGLASPGVEVPYCVGDTSDQQKSCDDGSGLASENQFGSFLENPETRAFQETTDPLILEVHDKEVAGSVVLLENLDATKSGNNISNDANINSGLASTDQEVLDGVSAKGLALPGVEVPYCVGDTSDQQKSCDDGSGLASENQFGSFLETPETRAFQETTDPLNLEVHDKEVAGSVVLLENPDATKSGNSISNDANINSDLASTDQKVLDGASAKGLASPEVEVPYCVGDTSDQQKSCDDGSGLASENQFGSFLETPETRAFQETTDPLNLEVHDKEVAGSVVLLENPDATKSGNNISNDANINSGLASTDQKVLDGASAKGLASPGVEVPYCVGDTSDQQKSCDDGSGLASENQFGSFLETPETRAFQETTDPLNLEVHDKEVAGSVVLLENHDATKSGNTISNNANVNTDTAALEETYRREETMMPDFSTEHILNKMQEHALGEEVEVAVGRADAQVHNINSQDNLVDNSTGPELHAPEKLLSVPEGGMDLHRDMLVEGSPSVIEVFDTGDTRCKTAVGRKRSFTESTLTEQSLNSVESSRQVRVKRTAESVPDDDDLLSSILVGRKSSVLKVKPTPPFTEVTSMKRCCTLPRSAAPKRKVLMDDKMVLHGDTIRHQLTNTEDIRRVRKKAPCTFAEITMIQKKQLEDDFFLGTIFTGISVGLASLHGQAYDLSRISICKDDANGPSLQTVTEARLPSENDKNDAFLDAVNGPSLETVTEASLPSQNDKNDVSLDHANGASLETVTEPRLPSRNDINDAFLADVNVPSLEIVTEARLPSLNDKNDAFLEIFESNLASLDDKYDVSRDTVAGSQLTSPNNENHDKGPGNNNVTDTSQQGINLLVARNDELTNPFENPLLSGSRLEEVNYTSTYVNFSQEQTKPTNDVEPNDSQVIPEVDPLDPTGHARGDIGGDTSVGMVQTDSLYESGERNSHVHMDASAVVLSAELDYVDGDGGQPIARNEVAEKDGDANMDGETGLGEKDDILPGGTQDVAVEMALDVNQGELENNLEAKIYSTTLEGQKEVEFSREALVWGMEDGFMNNDENLSHSKAYQPNVTDVEVSGFDQRDQDDINQSDAGNDTEFLKVEDDELTEIADDQMPDGEETRYTDNSGWSSRTRAVCKYLHTAFAKEAECGRKFLSMDDILNGKSRKEASRMFFETLVLKTRDYIHVEQPNPHGEITIKPQTRLMKSDF